MSGRGHRYNPRSEQARMEPEDSGTVYGRPLGVPPLEDEIWGGQPLWEVLARAASGAISIDVLA